MSALKLQILPAALFVLFMLSACGAPSHKVVTPELRGQMMNDLKQGRAVLRSDLNNTLHFIWFWQRMTEAYNAQQWEMLAELVMQNGFASDITYYFLGVSAEQLGYPEAALKYYVTAINFYNDGVRDHHCREVLSAEGCPLDLRRILPVRADNIRKFLAAEEQRKKAEEDAKTAPVDSKKKIKRQSASVSPKVTKGNTHQAPSPAPAATLTPAPELQKIPLEPILTTTSSPGKASPEPSTTKSYSAEPAPSKPDIVAPAPVKPDASTKTAPPETKKGGGLNDLAKDAL